MEKKQLLYIITSVGLALILFIVGAIWLLSTKKQSANSLASVQSIGTAAGGPGVNFPTAGSPASSAQAAGNLTAGTMATDTQNSVAGPAGTVGSVSPTGASNLAGGQGPASADNRVNPTEWVKNPQTVQGLQPPPATTPASRGDVIIVYGDNTVTSKTTGTLPGTGTDPNSVVIQVPSPQGIVSPTSGTTITGSTSTVQTVETKSTQDVSPSVQITQTKTTGSTKTSAETAAPKTTTTKSTPKVYTDYWVQTGAYSTKVRAESVKEQLQTKGITSVLDVKDVNGKTYYRVRIGPYTTQKEAQYWLALVKNIDGFSESYISSVQVKR
ncbi:SPOR domain-containing protein [Gracilinema caldarium]|uniref:Sporulation domain-containing protein n=1 Tax=Gracilinema caldarium (strain ATCC 51460 / DSM 7334 / H1) TaxID=744872 RepID=F8EYN5_GRAC1|nr:SPOR domain-containing protein [Gracilinema caldarium]AEJ18612.1 Sporulation domain-containing protein [Gracilinema caldarium DSM 7334]